MADQGQSRESVWAGEISLDLMGPVRLGNLAGENLTPKSRKTRALLAMVALSRTPVPRARLADMLWGDRGEEQAKASLRQALYELRAATVPELIETDRHLVSLGPRKIATDIGAIEQAITAVDAPELSDLLERSAWPLLADLDDITPEFDEWLRDERAKTAATIVNGALRVAEEALQSTPAAARGIADAIERIEPLEERAVQIGITADLAAGDRLAATRRHARFAERLRRDLGIEPAPETDALLKGAPAAGPLPAHSRETAEQTPARQQAGWRVPAAILVAALAIAALLFFLRPFAAAAPVTLAVLPFEHSGAPGRDYVASGVSDEILNLLSDQRQMRVLGRVSAAEIASQPDSLDAARRLGITHLVDGNVRSGQDRILVIVRMTRVSDGAQIWSERYERRLGDIFAVQGDIASSVASKLARSFGASRPQGTKPEVYDRYLAARSLVRERREVTLREAERLLREAVALDPNYAPAHAELAQVIMLLVDHPTSYGSRSLQEARGEAERLARRAVALDPNLGEAYAAMGFLNLNPDERTVPYYRKAVELSPQRAEYHRWLGQSLYESGRYEEGLEEFRRAVAIDPLWALSYDHLIGALYHVGREAEGRQVARRFLALTTDRRAKLLLMQAMAKHDGRVAEWLKHSRALYRSFPDERQSRFNHASALASLGEREAALRIGGLDALARAALAADWDELVSASRSRGGSFWELIGDFWSAPALLVASGNSAVLVELYDQAQPLVASGALRPESLAFAETVLALRDAGRGAEAERVLALFRREAEARPTKGRLGEWRAQDLAYASLLSGAPGPALGWLDRVSRTEPLGLVSTPLMSLRHRPVFRSIAGDPRLAAIDERVRTAVNGQRAQAGLRPLSKAQWISNGQTLLTMD